MSVDLRKCKKGDKLLSVHGEIIIYVSPTEAGNYYDHYVQYMNGSLGTRTHDGFVYRNLSSRMECDHDISEIIQ